MLSRAVLTSLVLVGCLFGSARVSASRADLEPKTTALGDRVANSNSLRDLRGNRRALHDFKGNRALVLAFVGAECPVSNVTLPSLIALEKQYRPKQVQFLAIYPNEHEDLDR